MEEADSILLLSAERAGLLEGLEELTEDEEEEQRESSGGLTLESLQAPEVLVKLIYNGVRVIRGM